MNEGRYGVLGGAPCESAPGVGVEPAGPAAPADGSCDDAQSSNEGAQVGVAVASRIDCVLLTGSGVPRAMPVLTGANASGVQGR